MNAPDLERLRDWEGREEVRDDVIALAPVQALAATLDHDPEIYLDDEILPPLYHWLFFLELTKLGGLAADGHAEKGEFMPPAPFPRRMFAGARVDYSGDLRIGESVRRVSTIAAVRPTEGRSGPVIFVTVAHRVSNESGLQLLEEQDIAYLPSAATPASSPVTEATVPAADSSREVCPDERMLFRFSALTFNSHRIHYDLPYAQSEGYPGLVVHGPLTAVFLADLIARESGRPKLQHFSFRAKSALFLGDRITLTSNRVDDAIELAAFNHKGIECVTAKAVLR